MFVFVAMRLVAFAVTFEVKNRRVTVKGPRGSLKREFRHLSIEMDKVSPKELRVRKWCVVSRVHTYAPRTQVRQPQGAGCNPYRLLAHSKYDQGRNERLSL
jgi:hypothetical protein